MAKLITTKKSIENETFKINIGTTNKKQPKTFYIELNCFAKIVNNEIEYDDDLMKTLSTAFRKMSVDIAKKYSFDSNTISNIECSEESLKNGKSAYLTIEMYFKQNSTDDFNVIYGICNNIIIDLLPSIVSLLHENNIECNKTK